MSLSVFAVLVSAGGAVAETPPPSPPVLSAALETCANGPLPEQRVAAFVGSMPARADASRMDMRFDLQRRRPGEHTWTRMAAAGLGTWERSLPDRAGFIFHKRVVGLPVAAKYRAVVRFRWESAAGEIVASARRVTRPCRLADLRPDLVPGTSLTAALASQPGLALYTLTVSNAGRSASAAFSVRLGSVRVDAAPLGAGEQRPVLVLAAVCIPGSLLTARVDEERRVDESREDDNSVRLPCPLRT